jgi:hypothetical protein
VIPGYPNLRDNTSGVNKYFFILPKNSITIFKLNTYLEIVCRFLLQRHLTYLNLGIHANGTFINLFSKGCQVYNAIMPLFSQY